jgi:hypothetical protein
MCPAGAIGPAREAGARLGFALSLESPKCEIGRFGDLRRVRVPVTVAIPCCNLAKKLVAGCGPPSPISKRNREAMTARTPPP